MDLANDETLNHLADAIARRLLAEQTRLIDRDELARRVGLCRRTTFQLVARGHLPAGYLIGGVRRWDWGEVKKYLATRPIRRRKGRGGFQQRSTGVNESANQSV